jgi:hypothetical protein
MMISGCLCIVSLMSLRGATARTGLLLKCANAPNTIVSYHMSAYIRHELKDIDTVTSLFQDAHAWLPQLMTQAVELMRDITCCRWIGITYIFSPPP